MGWTVFLSIWAVLLVADIVLGVKRATIAHQLDGSVHVFETDKIINEQVNEEQSLEKLGFWAKWLTILAITYGLALAGAYAYHLWKVSLTVAH